MMKKIAFILFAIMAMTATAQSDGMWKSHPRYLASNAQNLVDNGKLVLFQSGNHLFAFNKETGEIGPFDKGNGAFDINAQKIFYNHESNFTVVTYDNSNIDIVRNDGTVVNVPDIKDAVYNGVKGINDITFSGGKMCIATEFGVVIMDSNTLQITDTYYYNKNISSALLLGDLMLISFEDEIYYDNRKNHDNFNKFINTNMALPEPSFVAINNEKFFIKCNGELYKVDVEITDDVSFQYNTVAAGVASSIQRTPTGFIASFPTTTYYYTFDENGDNATKVTAAKEYFSSNATGDGTIWALGANGLHEKEKTTYYNPNGWGISQNAFYSTYNPGDGKVYVNRTCDNAIIGQYNPSKPEIWSYDGDKWSDVTPVGAPTNDFANYWLVFEPGQTNSYFYSTRSKNIVHVVNDTVKHIHTASNSPLTFMNALRFDKDGNLWGVQSFRKIDYGGKYNPYVIALPKDKLNEAPAVENWIIPDINGKRDTNKRASLAISKGSDIKVYTPGDYNNPLLFWDNGGDINNLNPRTATYASLPDADGTTINWQNIRCLTPDSVGNIWAGTSSGLLYFNPAEAFDPSFKTHRIKIKMQGDAPTDYLLDGENVYCIAVDNQNRKWIGTATQGVYLLSADNKTILAQFDASNSALPSNNVYTICPKPNSNSVIFVCDAGIAEYFFEVSSDVESYDNVQAYPNPLKPDFTGYVTISGLVNNSLVKITDRRGNVVAQLQAQGPIAKWDGCDSTTGERLATGVYYVYAGKDEASMSTNAVTKIHIIK